MAEEKVQEIRVGDTGTKLEVEITEWDDNTKTYIAVNIVLATVKNIVLKRPDGTLVTVVGILSTDGTDGKMYLTTIGSHLTIEGTYYIQGIIALDTWQGSSSIGEFIVHENLV